MVKANFGGNLHWKYNVIIIKSDLQVTRGFLSNKLNSCVSLLIGIFSGWFIFNFTVTIRELKNFLGHDCFNWVHFSFIKARNSGLESKSQKSTDMIMMIQKTKQVQATVAPVAVKAEETRTRFPPFLPLAPIHQTCFGCGGKFSKFKWAGKIRICA